MLADRFYLTGLGNKIGQADDLLSSLQQRASSKIPLPAHGQILGGLDVARQYLIVCLFLHSLLHSKTKQ
jgi:hypothetical protein